MKILYGVPSEGMGHATRSKVVITHLLARGHDVRIATSDRAFDLLEKSFPGRCYRIEGLHLKYDAGTVDRWASFKNLVKTAPESLTTNLEAFRKVHKEFAPEVVVSDFESFTYYYAKVHRLPLVSIDNMQAINRCDLDLRIPPSESENHALAKAIIKAKVPFCDLYLVSAFFSAPPRKERTEMIPPILRENILQASPTTGDHIVVYQTSTSQDDLLPCLQAVRGVPFKVYGFNRSESHGNVELMKFSEDGFIADLASSRAVITNGGYSLISEAVYLRKPVLSFPLKGQFEQFVNGAQIERMGYGRRFDDFHPDAIKAFLFDLEAFRENLSGYSQDGNQATFDALDRFLANPTAPSEDLESD
ncbi:MAG: UDP-glucuronosyltransferase [Fibrobacteria bacterium]|nr:UDP-glucuronosyltransferase [Fibrobacteria bacterium]